MQLAGNQSKTALINESCAAQLLGCTKRALQRWRLVGDGPTFVKVGRLVRYRPKDIEAFIDSNLRTSTSDVGGMH